MHSQKEKQELNSQPTLLIKRKKLLEELEKLEINIKTLENEFSMYIEDEWTKEEINEAKEKAKLNY